MAPIARAERRNSSPCGGRVESGRPQAACPDVNGFQTVPELDSLDCRAGNISQYSLPSEALSFEPAPELVVSPFENGDRERKIHCNVELEANEQEKLVALQREAKAQGLKFFPSVTAMATRFLSHSRMDVKKALKCMQATQEWRKNYFKDGPVRDTSVYDDLKHGIAYFSGRDRDLRPALVVRGNRIPAQWYKEKRVDKLIRLLVFCMEYMLHYMVVPGRVENLCVIVDLKGLSFSQVSIGALGEVYKVMSNHYSGRVFRFYVANVPAALGMIAGVAKSLLTDRQKQKLVVLKDVKELRKYFALHQLEDDLGGARPAISEFYPFPLQAGPFEAGCKEGPDSNAVPDVHLALPASSATGRLWDPRKSKEENVSLDYSVEAESILARCGLPVPARSIGKAVKQADAKDWTPASSEAKTTESPRGCCRISSNRSELQSQDPMQPYTWPRRVSSHSCEVPCEVSTDDGTVPSIEPPELEQDRWEAFDGAVEFESNETHSDLLGCGWLCGVRRTTIISL